MPGSSAPSLQCSWGRGLGRGGRQQGRRGQQEPRSGAHQGLPRSPLPSKKASPLNATPLLRAANPSSKPGGVISFHARRALAGKTIGPAAARAPRRFRSARLLNEIASRAPPFSKRSSGFTIVSLHASSSSSSPSPSSFLRRCSVLLCRACLGGMPNGLPSMVGDRGLRRRTDRRSENAPWNNPRTGMVRLSRSLRQPALCNMALFLATFTQSCV